MLLRKQFSVGRDLKLKNFKKRDLQKLSISRGGIPSTAGNGQRLDLTPASITGLKDLEKLPIITADDFKESISKSPPFGEHQGIGLQDGIPIKIQTSGGTTGKPRPTLFPPLEWEVQAIKVSRSLYIQGARPGDVIQIPLTLSTANMGWSYYRAAHGYLSCAPITTGSGLVTSSSRQIELALDWGANIWASFPEYLMRLASVAQQDGIELADLKTKFIASYLGDAKIRKPIEDAWCCDVFDNYGTHELGAGAFECQEKSGLHVFEDFHIMEIVDMESGEPLETGKVGEIVVTSLYRQHPPLIRYNLKDLTRVIHKGRCRCGSNLIRIDHFMGRADDMVKIRGTNVFPAACGSILVEDKRFTGEWLCVVERLHEGLEIKDEFIVKVEYADETIDREELTIELENRLHAVLGVRVAVKLVSAGALKQFTTSEKEGKVRRLLDRR